MESSFKGQSISTIIWNAVTDIGDKRILWYQALLALCSLLPAGVLLYSPNSFMLATIISSPMWIAHFTFFSTYFVIANTKQLLFKASISKTLATIRPKLGSLFIFTIIATSINLANAYSRYYATQTPTSGIIALSIIIAIASFIFGLYSGFFMPYLIFNDTAHFFTKRVLGSSLIATFVLFMYSFALIIGIGFTYAIVGGIAFKISQLLGIIVSLPFVIAIVYGLLYFGIGINNLYARMYLRNTE